MVNDNNSDDAKDEDDDDDDDDDGAGDGTSSEYMQVLTYNADDDADNVYLSLLDIVSIEERQIQVSNEQRLFTVRTVIHTEWSKKAVPRF